MSPSFVHDSSNDSEDFEDFENLDTIPSHAKKNCCFMSSYKVVSHPMFNMFIIFVILLNIVVLSMDSIYLTEKQLLTIEIFNDGVQLIFFLEMVVKLFGLGFRDYLRDRHNWLDSFIVVTSTAEFIMHFAMAEQSQTAKGALTALRGIRLLRVLKLARSWTTFRNLLRWLYQTFSASIMFIVLFCLFMFVFMLIGMEFYSHEIFFNSDGKPTDKKNGKSPRANFDDPWESLITIFIVAVGDDWNSIMYDFYRYLKPTSDVAGIGAIGFFVLMYIMMNMLLLNLFLAILLDSYGTKPDDYQEVKEEEEEEQADDIGPVYICLHLVAMRALIFLSKLFPCCISSPDLTELEESSASHSDTLTAQSAFGITDKPKMTLERQRIGRIQHDDCDQHGQVKTTTSPRLLTDQLDEQSNQSQHTLVNLVDQQGTHQNLHTDTEKTTSMLKSQPTMRKSFSNLAIFMKKKKLDDIDRDQVPAALMALRVQRMSERKKKRQQQEKQFLRLKYASAVSLGSVKLKDLDQRQSYKARPLAKMTGNSLHCFHSKHKVRRCLQRLILHPCFENMVLVFIFLSTALLIFENPLYDPDAPEKKIIDIAEEVMTTLFLLECVIKIIVYGFCCNGPFSYVKSTWNIVDFMIAIISSLSFLNLPENFHVVKIFRMVRVLRPLRLVNRFPQMRIAVESIFHSVPQFANLMIIFILTLLLFSILGTNLFKGKYNYCYKENVSKKMKSDILTMWDCVDFGGEWINPKANFDTTFNSMITLFTAVTTEGWVGIMWGGVDAAGFHLEPRRNYNYGYSVYFISFMMFCSLVILNLFVGVVINTNASEKNKMLNNHMLTPLQIEYSDTLTKCYNEQPQAKYQSQNACKDWLQKIAVSKCFEDCITVLILLNTACMAATWYGEDNHYTDVMWMLENVFAFIYLLEAIIIISVQGKRYFHDGWNQFDFIIVVSALLGFFLEVILKLKQATWTTILRVFRIMRIFKMVKRFRQLHMIFNTFVIALPNLAQVGSLLSLFLLIMAVLGEFLFAKIMLPTEHKHDGGLEAHVNFQSFPAAMLTLLRMCTGEAWNSIMWDASKGRSILYKCLETEQSYADLVAEGPKQCGQSSSAIAYFVTFIIIGVFIMMNMFISLILDGYELSTAEDKMRINDQTIQKFKKCWMKYDPNATGMIEVEDLKQLVIDLVLEELQEVESFDGQYSDEENILFNMRLDPKLVVFAKWERGLELDSEIMKKVANNGSLQNQVIRSWKRFGETLKVPTYKKLKFYQFHDLLTTLVRHGFLVQHHREWQIRQERIEKGRKAGIQLTKWEVMKEDSYVFKKLDIADQERFLEITTEDFTSVVDRIEEKALRQGSEEIYKLKMMKESRSKADAPYIGDLDKFVDGKIVVVIDSSKIIGAKYLLNFIIRWKERKAEKIKQEKALQDEQKVRDSSTSTTPSVVEQKQESQQQHKENKPQLKIILEPVMKQTISEVSEEKDPSITDEKETPVTKTQDQQAQTKEDTNTLEKTILHDNKPIIQSIRSPKKSGSVPIISLTNSKVTILKKPSPEASPSPDRNNEYGSCEPQLSVIRRINTRKNTEAHTEQSIDIITSMNNEVVSKEKMEDGLVLYTPKNQENLSMTHEADQIKPSTFKIQNDDSSAQYDTFINEKLPKNQNRNVPIPPLPFIRSSTTVKGKQENNYSEARKKNQTFQNFQSARMSADDIIASSPRVDLNDDGSITTWKNETNPFKLSQHEKMLNFATNQKYNLMFSNRRSMPNPNHNLRPNAFISSYVLPSPQKSQGRKLSPNHKKIIDRMNSPQRILLSVQKALKRSQTKSLSRQYSKSPKKNDFYYPEEPTTITKAVKKELEKNKQKVEAEPSLLVSFARSSQQLQKEATDPEMRRVKSFDRVYRTNKGK